MQIDNVSSENIINQYASAKHNADGAFSKTLEKATENAATAADDAKLKATCKEFEALFLNYMYTQMRDTIPENSLIGESSGEKIMQSMLDTELTKNMANAGGIGLGNMIYKQLSMSMKAKPKNDLGAI
ncbi:rod-binding protein [Anaerosinus massiliensis]|uniref:rod-binding protein n=1 Tax=Massilibacillus massiliensis TaxID=1806837 RepID=UPI000DA60CA9|nr:rod-binding protein [Massilibacillus massiliensis]